MVAKRSGVRRTVGWLLSVSLIGLAGCGGGGGDGGSPAPTPPPAGSTGVTATVTGTTASGEALAGATIAIRCAQGSASATSDAAGRYSLQLEAAQGPCMLSGTGGSSAAPRAPGPLHAVLPGLVAGQQTANLTPLTELQAARLFSQSPANAWDACCGAGAIGALITPANATAAQAAVYAELVARLGLTDASLAGRDWVGSAFQVGDAFDRQLEVLDARLAASGLNLATAVQQIGNSGQIQATPGNTPANCVPGLIAGYSGPMGDDPIPATQWVGAGDPAATGGGSLAGPGGPGGGGVVVAEGGVTTQVHLSMNWADGRQWSVLAPEGRATFVACGYSGPALFTATPAAGAQYFDVGLGRLVDLPANFVRRSMVPSLARNVGVTPFSESAWRFLDQHPSGSVDAGTGLTLRLSPPMSLPWTQVMVQALANDVAGRALTDLVPAALRRAGGQAGSQTIDVTRMPVVLGPATAATPATLPDTDNGRYGAILGGFSKTAARHLGANPAPTPSMTGVWTADLADGVQDLRANGGQIGGDGQAFAQHNLWMDLTAGSVEVARAAGAGSLAALNTTLQMLRLNLTQGGCVTSETLRLRADGSLQVSRTASGLTPVAYEIQGQHFAEMAVTAHGYPSSEVSLLSQDRRQVHRLSLRHDCSAIAVEAAPVEKLAAPAGQVFVVLRHARTDGTATGPHALLRSSTGLWFDDSGAQTALGSDVIDVAATDPALQSEYINPRRLIALLGDGSLSLYASGIDGGGAAIPGVTTARQLSNTGFSVFARTAEGEVYWVNAGEAGTQGDANFSLPAEPGAPPRRLTGLSERACWIGDLSVVTCSGAVAKIAETVYGTSTQGGRYLVDVAPAVESSTLAQVWRTVGVDPMAYQSSLMSQGTAGGDWYLTQLGGLLDANGTAVANP